CGPAWQRHVPDLRTHRSGRGQNRGSGRRGGRDDRLRRVVAALVPRVTPPDSADAAPRATNRPVLTHRENEILTAARLEPARRRQNRADTDLIAADARNQPRRQESPRPGDHDFSFSWSFASFFAT